MNLFSAETLPTHKILISTLDTDRNVVSHKTLISNLEIDRKVMSKI